MQSKRVELMIQWFMKKMDLSDKIIIHYGFTKFESPNRYAELTKLNDSYYINIRKSLLACNEYHLVEFLFHEMVHIYQYEKEGLKVLEDEFVYENVKYSFDMDYDHRPWEINAFNWSKKLAMEYVSGLTKL